MKSNKINITFALPNRLSSGAERVSIYVAQNIDKHRFNVALLVFGYSKDACYEVKNIEVVYLEISRVLNGIPALYNYIRKNKPDILVRAVGRLNALVAYISIISNLEQMKTAIKVLIEDHSYRQRLQVESKKYYDKYGSPQAVIEQLTGIKKV